MENDDASAEQRYPLTTRDHIERGARSQDAGYARTPEGHTLFTLPTTERKLQVQWTADGGVHDAHWVNLDGTVTTLEWAADGTSKADHIVDLLTVN